MFADEHAGQFGFRRPERATDFGGAVRLGIERVDLTRPSGHPKQNDALLSRRGSSSFESGCSLSKQFGKRKPRDSGKAEFEQIATADEQPVSRMRVEGAEGMRMNVCHVVTW